MPTATRRAAAARRRARLTAAAAPDSSLRAAFGFLNRPPILRHRVGGGTGSQPSTSLCVYRIPLPVAPLCCDMTPFPAELHAALKAQWPEDLAPIVSKKVNLYTIK